MPSITGATSTFTLTIPGLFGAPQTLQGFEADNVFDTEPIDSAEYYMGVDGILSAGFVFVPIRQTVMLQADSPSAPIFDAWWTTMQAIKDVLFANGNVVLTAIGTKWNMSNGILTSYQPMPNVKKLLQPRHFTITWNTISPSAS
jgi:hypothetical protein